MSKNDYVPRGSTDFIVDMPSGKQITVKLAFHTEDDYQNMMLWAASVGWKPDYIFLDKHSMYAPPSRSSNKPACTIHGPGKHILKNKNGGQHTHFCAKKLDDSSYCSQKIFYVGQD